MVTLAIAPPCPMLLREAGSRRGRLQGTDGWMINRRTSSGKRARNPPSSRFKPGEPNLIERLWRFVRKRSLDSTYYEAFEPFTTAIDQCLDGLPTVHKGEMETLLTHEFQTFGEVPLLAA